MEPLTFIWPGESPGTTVRPAREPEEIESRADLLLIDSRVEALWGARLSWNKPRVVIPGGEACKTHENLVKLWKSFAEAGINRESAVCVTGGGSVCDLGALAASTWMRGVGLELVPTTLLCMADACLGGKTALNLSGVKNQVGTFHPAETITICTAFLKTLPEAELLSGKAEVVKTGLIGDRKACDAILRGDCNEAVSRCLSVKGRIVRQDLNDRGVRKILNLGHTLGHALEMLLSISHGEAVALGIPAAARMGGENDLALELESTIAALGLPTRLSRPPEAEEVMPLIRRDKKTTGDGRVWVIPRGWEDCRLEMIPPDREEKLLREALKALGHDR
jgi:3-dehydroquinate synthase